jgi:hypothetical protein
MRAQLVAATVAVGAVFAGFPTDTPAQAGDEDSAVGNVITAIFRPTGFVFDAQSGPLGENPRGTALWTDRGPSMGGPVTCLTVTGNRATIGFENQLGGAPTLSGGFLFVEDNGTPGAGQDNASARLVLAPPTICPPNTVVYDDLHTVTSGELSVHDAPALPSTRDQCKNGGWRGFGVFKNQGDCVSFVATGGQNQASGGWPR